MRTRAHRQYVSFYTYTPLRQLSQWKIRLQSIWGNELGILGRVYVAKEGINAQITLPDEATISKLQHWVSSQPELKDSNIFWNKASINTHSTLGKNTSHTSAPFENLRIKIRKALVNDGLQKNDITFKDRGEELSASEWHDTINSSDPSTLRILDCRNHYEHEIGRFVGAERIMVDVYRDTFPALDQMLSESDKTKSDIMIYCTGGIRCEKVGGYLKSKGFKNVKRLQGGIVNYLEKFDTSVSLFKGKNFVFDDRVVTNSSGSDGSLLGRCFQCHNPCDTYINCSNATCGALVLQCSVCSIKLSGACSVACLGHVKRESSLNALEQKQERKTRSVNHPLMTIRPRYKPPVSSVSVVNCREFSTTMLREDYCIDKSSIGFSQELESIRQDTIQNWSRSQMLLDKSSALTLAFLLRSWKVKNVLELGCFTGFSALLMAEAISENDGHVTTCDIDENCIEQAKLNFERHPLGSVVKPLLQDGMTTLRNASNGVPYDCIFIDANKKAYQSYYDTILQQHDILTPNGFMIFDNILFRDSVISAPESNKIALSLHEFNQYVAQDSRTENIMLPIGDGLTIVQRRRCLPPKVKPLN